MCNLSCVAKRGISGTRGARCTSSAFELNMPDIERIQSDEVAVIGGWNVTCEHGLAVPIIEQILLINQRTHLLGEKTAIYGQQDIPGAPCTSNPGHSDPRYGFYSGSFSLSSKSRTTSISAHVVCCSHIPPYDNIARTWDVWSGLWFIWARTEMVQELRMPEESSATVRMCAFGERGHHFRHLHGPFGIFRFPLDIRHASLARRMPGYRTNGGCGASW